MRKQQERTTTTTMSVTAPVTRALCDGTNDSGNGQQGHPNEVATSVSESGSVDQLVHLFQARTNELDETLFGKNLRVVALRNGGKAVQFTGRVGVASRCVRAKQPLPKPQAITLAQPQQNDEKEQKPVSQKVSSKNTWPRLIRKRNKTKQTQCAVTSENSHKTVWKPFVEPFLMQDGAVSMPPRLVSYYEVHIHHPNNVTALLSSSTSSSSSKSCLAEEEKVPEDQDWQEWAPPTPTIIDNISRVEKFTTDDVYTSDCIAVGVAQLEFKLNDWMPGWDALSHAFHGDDGSVFFNHSKRTNFGPAFGIGDVVGCGLDYRAGAVFYTWNGVFLGYTFQLTDQQLCAEWYPTIGLDSHACIECNTTGRERPFCFDLQAMCEKNSNSPENKSPSWKGEMLAI